MVGKIKAVLALLSFAGVAAKFGGLLGPVGAMAGAVVTLVLQIVKWFFEGLTIIVSNTVTLVTVGVFCAVSFAGGAKLGMDQMRSLVDRKEAVINKMLSDSKRLDDANKLKLKDALSDKAKAEQAERDKIATEAKKVTTTDIKPDVPAEPKRVRKPRTSCKDSGSGSGLFGPGTIWGSALPCKST